MLRPTIQSKKVILTGEEKAFLATKTDKDLLNMVKALKQQRELINSIDRRGVSIADHYKEMQGKQELYYPGFVVCLYT